MTSSSIHWQDANGEHTAHWHSEAGVPPPTRVVLADDTMRADTAYRLACEGTALLWQGDFQNAKQLLQAMVRRLDELANKAAVKAASKRPRPAGKGAVPALSMAEQFHRYRMQRAQRARVLGRLLIPLTAELAIPLRRAPEVSEACREAFGETAGAGGTVIASVLSLRELLGIIGAFEWRKKGVEVAALQDRVFPHYGVFAPVRGEYVDLVMRAPLPAKTLAFDVGTGTGVLAAVLARRGVQKVVATECMPRALACARDNVARLEMSSQIKIEEVAVGSDGFPAMKERAPLIVCNPPWLPAKPGSPLESALYDFESRMLRGFLSGLSAHLAPGGEGWLLLSDLAEHLGLRSREELLGWIDAAGLQVADRLDAKPRHPRVADIKDPLHAARASEVTSLWRLTAKTQHKHQRYFKNEKSQTVVRLFYG